MTTLPFHQKPRLTVKPRLLRQSHHEGKRCSADRRPAQETRPDCNSLKPHSIARVILLLNEAQLKQGLQKPVHGARMELRRLRNLMQRQVFFGT